ncbi:MAG TPA: hypothetical protein VG675_16240 [Bryobacteraceae bacterium]|nr:hypothetical protein [Bryobacteraceae bacterium]
MKIRVRSVVKLAACAAVLLLALGIVAPYLGANQYGKRLRGSLERALGRQVEIGEVRFSLFKGPGFSVDRVVIHDDPSIGIEPLAYVDTMEVTPSIWSLLGGRFVIASIRLDDASINLTKSGAASEPGRWNFTSFLNRSVMRNVPAIHVRDGRINFKFGDTKSVFYLTQTDLDISPSGSGGSWSIACSGAPARTDRPAQGLGAFDLKGHWYVAPERVDLNFDLDRTGLAELTALMRGQSGGIHGTVSSHLHLAGPINRVGILGRLTVEDVHRWDLLPPMGVDWPLEVRGSLDLAGQRLELQTRAAMVPVTVRFQASDYLSQPHWGVAVNWDRFPAAPILQLARHMGAQLPPGLELSGTMDGAIGYSGQGSFQGELAFHDTALTIPDSPPIRFDEARVLIDHGHVHVAPALVRTASQDQAKVEADYGLDDQTLNLSISTNAMKVASLREQVALAAVPWLDRLRSGQWGGQLHYTRTPAEAGWTGRLDLTGAEISVPGLAAPLELASARVQIDGARVALERIQGKAGNAVFRGDYRYEPDAPRPHRLHIQAEQLDAADVEAELMPTLRRNTGFLARALGRSTVPEWLRQRGLEGTIAVDDLLVGGLHLGGFRSRVLWDATRVELDGIQARLDRASIAGRLTANLRGSRPSYRLTAKVKNLAWQSGELDLAGTLETSGTAAQLLTNLTSKGTFAGTGLDFGEPPVWQAISGSYQLAWTRALPHLSLTDLQLRTDDDEVYTGQGATQNNGHLVILLTNGAKEMRMSGTLAKLKFDETAKP